MYINPVDVEGLVFMVSSIPFGSYALYASSFLQSSLSSGWRDVMETSPVELTFPKSLILCIIYDCGSPICFHLLQEEVFLMVAEQGTDSTAGCY